jgi:signal transduction histidine kinase
VEGRDVTEQRRASEQLRQAQKMEAIGQLTGGVAHDFNNLLQVLSGGLEMLDRQTDPVRRRQRLIDGMHQAVERGASLTRQLLAFSRRQQLRPEPVDIGAQIDAMCELLDRSLRGDIEVETRFPPDLWPVEVDPGALELVILNLCVNARDALPGGGTITIAAANAPGLHDRGLHGDFIQLSVTDTGTAYCLIVALRHDQVGVGVFLDALNAESCLNGSARVEIQIADFCARIQEIVRPLRLPGDNLAIG